MKENFFTSKRFLGFVLMIIGTLIVLFTDKGGWGGFLAGVGLALMF